MVVHRVGSGLVYGMPQGVDDQLRTH
jgi:hypothetical protein